MKKLDEFTFHSKHLVPSEIGKAGVDKIIEWIEKEQQDYRFVEGEEVVHKDNPTLTMYVKEILKEKRSIKTGSDQNGKPLMKSVSRMIGIRCYFWADAETGD